MRRYKWAVQIFVASIGIIFFCASGFVARGTDALVIYDILMGLGGGLVSTAAITVILLILLPDDTEKLDELKDWGLEGIIPERSDIKLSGEQLPKRNLDMIAFGLRHFREANRDDQVIIDRLNAGLNIRIISLNPNSAYVIEEERLENTSELRSDLLNLHSWVKRIQESKMLRADRQDSIEIKLYDNLPLNFYCRADDKIYTGPYCPGEISSRTHTFLFNFNGTYGKYYAELFNRLWSGAVKINMVHYYEDYFPICQKDSVCTTLEYFCRKISSASTNKDDVIGVVAIFKGDLRRTFFSCNKREKEGHHCHKKYEGTVGEMLRVFKNNNHQTDGCFFSDYENDMAFVYWNKSRNDSIIKLKDKATAMGEDTAGILAVPLIRGRRIIGVLTFDFLKLPSEYTKCQAELEKCKEGGKIPKNSNVNNSLKEWFTIAIECRNIIVNMLGQNVGTEYKKLYEDEWR